MFKLIQTHSYAAQNKEKNIIYHYTCSKVPQETSKEVKNEI